MNPGLKNHIVADIKRIIPELPRGLSQASKYILDHPSDFGLDPIRETGSKAGVSTYTLIRLAEKLGFKTFDELREPFRQALVSTTGGGDQPTWIEELQQHGELGKVQAATARNGMAIVQRSLEHLDPDSLHRITQLLLKAENVYLMGMRASYSLASYFHYVGRMALPALQLIPRHMNSATDDLNNAGPGDVLIAITVTPYSRETIEACQFALHKGARLILLSDSEIVSSDLVADETLIASVHSTHHLACYTGMLAIIETLIGILVAEGGDAAQQRIRSYEDLRASTHVYWTGKKG
ncbi:MULTISPECIES: MurR/RpiR family transcriptional regulator [Cobetia]|uniref:MurR/RpiR family transcriptional regulator n=1 Tax=Cobetia TaxID=204286 RepID=UPI000987519D|nr:MULTISPECIES: MurR/RpiR family transcriptional regulator [Cobetia]POR08921.1 iron dicitrate transport regulator FecR [Cobetia sp. MM1IDA2H-1]